MGTLDKNAGIVCAEVEYEETHGLPANLQKVRGFPTIQIIQNERIKDQFAGFRTHDEVVAFALKHALPPAVGSKRSAPKASSASTKKKVKTKISVNSKVGGKK